VAGDRCLRAVADAVQRVQRRAGDVAARYGGEELAVVLPGATLSAATAVGESLRAEVQELAVPHAGSPAAPVVTVSVGVASARGGSVTPTQIVDAADGALYRAKQRGRNRVEAMEVERPAPV
jgi:diguanylate cyclase (GGDEF)-like protein